MRTRLIPQHPPTRNAVANPRWQRYKEALLDEPARDRRVTRTTKRGAARGRAGATMVNDDHRPPNDRGIFAEHRDLNRMRDLLALRVEHLHRQVDLLLDKLRMGDRGARANRREKSSQTSR